MEAFPFNLKQIIDHKYFFPVSDYICKEMENRSSRYNPKTSTIGLGPVSASIIKQNIRDVINKYRKCIKYVQPMEQYSQIRTQELLKSRRERENLTSKLIRNFEKPPKQTKQKRKRGEIQLHQLVIDYHKRCKQHHDFGSIGLLPEMWRKKDTFPESLPVFSRTLACKHLQHFCQEMLKSYISEDGTHK